MKKIFFVLILILIYIEIGFTRFITDLHASRALEKSVRMDFPFIIRYENGYEYSLAETALRRIVLWPSYQGREYNELNPFLQPGQKPDSQ